MVLGGSKMPRVNDFAPSCNGDGGGGVMRECIYYCLYYYVDRKLKNTDRGHLKNRERMTARSTRRRHPRRYIYIF